MSAVNLTCTAEGHPAPTYEWYKDGVLIPGEHLPFLYIPDVLPEDRGIYSCKAINTRGEKESESASLEIPGNIKYSSINFHDSTRVQLQLIIHVYSDRKINKCLSLILHIVFIYRAGLYQYSTVLELSSSANDTNEVIKY